MKSQVESRPCGEQRKVLVVDDEDDVREVAAAALGLIAGWRVVQASSGWEGLAAARNELPDVIVLDVRMPGLSGPETLHHLQNSRRTSAIPVIFLTAPVEAVVQRRLLEMGAAAVLFKPFDPLTLAADLSLALGW